MADLNALIAQGYQFQAPPDPFVQYGKMQQLQQGEQANQLNQMKMQEAQAAAATSAFCWRGSIPWSVNAFSWVASACALPIVQVRISPMVMRKDLPCSQPSNM